MASLSPTRTRSMSQEYLTCAPTLELVHSPTLPLTGGLGGAQPAEGDRKKHHLFIIITLQMVTHIPTFSCSVISALEPAQLMAESVICRGMFYSPCRTTVVVSVEMKWSVVLVSILYSSTTSPDSSSSFRRSGPLDQPTNGGRADRKLERTHARACHRENVTRGLSPPLV